MGKTANLELNTTEMSDKISDFVGEYNSNMNMLDDLYGDVQDDASSALSTAQSADTKATAAQTAAGNAVTTANSANSTAQSANTTAGQANTAATAAQTAASNAVTTANEAKTIAQNAAETAEGAEDAVANKADIDGNYETLTVGQAEQLVSTVYVEDSEPYNFRTSGGTADIGDRVYEEVVGGSIVWNQAVNETSITTGTFDGITATVSNHKLTITGTTERGTNVYVARPLSIVQGHKYLIAGTTKHYGMNLLFYAVDNSVMLLSIGAEKPLVGSAIVNATVSDEHAMFYFNIGGANAEVDVESVPQFFDLTQMFGSTIADYIYSLEQGTAGAGVAWFKKLFPKPYYEYNAGELMSVKAGSHDTVGFNALDRTACENNKMLAWATAMMIDETGSVVSDYIPVTPAPYRSKYTAYVFGYDADKNFVGAWRGYVNRWTIPAQGDAGWLVNSFTVDTGISYIRVVHRRNTGDIADYTQIDDMCVHLEWDGERNGEYEPYEKHEYPLANIELRGIPKLDASNQLYYDGDTYASDGTVTRKYGIVDLGTLNWSIDVQSGYTRFLASLAPVTGMPVRAVNTVCSKYISLCNNETFDTTWDKVLYAGGGLVMVHDSAYSDVATFKSAMNGVYLVYELAEPTTETADSFVSPQVVNDFGTEEYTDFAVEAGYRNVAIPVGHDSKYLNNLRAKLEMAPESPDGDGKYIVQQTNGENSYVPYTADGRLDAIEAKLPAPPSANGTYKLTAVVSNNGVTYSWQS